MALIKFPDIPWLFLNFTITSLIFPDALSYSLISLIRWQPCNEDQVSGESPMSIGSLLSKDVGVSTDDLIPVPHLSLYFTQIKRDVIDVMTWFSFILKHVIEKQHSEVDVSDVEIIGSNYRNKNLRLISEALLIKKFKPPLNVQGKSIPLKLFTWGFKFIINITMTTIDF